MHFTFSPENYATFARSLTVISLCDLFWYDLLSLPKVTGYNLYRTAPNKLRVGCVRLWFNVSRLCSTYIRVCVISANLAQNRVRLIHEVDLYTEIYGSSAFAMIYGCQKMINYFMGPITQIVSFFLAYPEFVKIFSAKIYFLLHHPSFASDLANCICGFELNCFIFSPQTRPSQHQGSRHEVSTRRHSLLSTRVCSTRCLPTDTAFSAPG